MYDWTRLHDLHRHAILTPQKEQSLANWARYQPPQALTVMVGPEGGFTETKEKAPSQLAPSAWLWGRASCARKLRD